MTRVVLASFDAVPSSKGAAQHILQNARILSKRYEVSLVTLGDEPLPDHRHLVVRLNEPNWLRRALAFRERLERVFELHEFDVHHVRSPWEGLAVKFGERILYEVNGLASIEAAYRHPRLVESPDIRAKLRRLEHALFDRATRLATPSDVTRSYLVDQGVDAGRIDVVPNAPTIPVPARVAPSLNPDTVRLVYIGTLTSWQGLGDVLSVLREPAGRFGAKRIVLTLVVTASSLQRRELERWSRRLGEGVELVLEPPRGVGELAELLSAQDIGLAPLVPCERNLVQGAMPLKILDYMAAGAAVLAPEMPVVRTLLGDGYPLYRRYSRSDLARTLEALASSAGMRRELGEMGRCRATDVFSQRRQRDALLGVYDRLTT